jgi:hypothetical protein
MSPNYMRQDTLERLIVQLSARDRAILLDLARVRVLTGDQLTRLHFSDLSVVTRDRMRRRVLARLVDHCLAATLDRTIGGSRAGSSGLIYTLGVAGQRALPLLGAQTAVHGPTRARSPWTPSTLFLGHTVAISDLYVALREWERAHVLTLARFAAEPASWHPNSLGGYLKPDAYAVLQTSDVEDCWWCEVDQATESLPTLKRKLLSYVDFARAGQVGPERIMPRVLLTVPHDHRLAGVRTIIESLPDPGTTADHPDPPRPGRRGHDHHPSGLNCDLATLAKRSLWQYTYICRQKYSHSRCRWHGDTCRTLREVAMSMATQVASEAAPLGVKRSVRLLRVSTKAQTDRLRTLSAVQDGNSIDTQRKATVERARHGHGQRRRVRGAGLLGPVDREAPVLPGSHEADRRAARRRLRRHLHAQPRLPQLHRSGHRQAQLDELGVKIVSAKEEFGDGRHGEAMEAITDVFNWLQVKISGQDIKTKMANKARNGGTIGKAKVGYRNVTKNIDGHKVKTIERDPERDHYIALAFQLMADGNGKETVESVQEQITEPGYACAGNAKQPPGPISHERLRVVLRDPYYKGVIVYEGIEYPGRHEALVSEELFDKVQRILDSHTAAPAPANGRTTTT